MRSRTPSGSPQLPDNTPPSQSADLKRRHFLLSLGAGGVGAAAVTIAALPGSAVAVETAAGTSDSGYRETEHVRDYYRTARV